MKNSKTAAYSIISRDSLILYIESMICNLKELFQVAEESDRNHGATKGVVFTRNERGKTRYYLKENGKEEYLGRKEQDKITEYADALYRKKLISSASSEIARMEKCLRILRDVRHNPPVYEVYDHLPDNLKKYVSEDAMFDSEYADEWLKSRFVNKIRDNAKDKYHPYETQNGEFVASKSEALIANILKDRGVPYQYEVAVTPGQRMDYNRPVFEFSSDGEPRLVGYEALGDGSAFSKNTLHPDFLVLNKRTRREYVWEHLGRLDDENYCKKNLNRMVEFINAGYKIGENMILTSESASELFDTSRINEVIDKYLI